jgi:hypothetical protein
MLDQMWCVEFDSGKWNYLWTARTNSVVARPTDSNSQTSWIPLLDPEDESKLKWFASPKDVEDYFDRMEWSFGTYRA